MMRLMKQQRAMMVRQLCSVMHVNGWTLPESMVLACTVLAHHLEAKLLAKVLYSLRKAPTPAIFFVPSGQPAPA
jgi:hypothetical protein